ncbi:MAG: M14 family metallopeptidase, partial [Planctomycetota bacterium]
MTTGFRLAAMALAIGAGGLPVARAQAEPDGEPAKYGTHAELSTRVDRLVAAHPRACTAESIGTSREGRAIWALRLALDQENDPDRRPAMLLAANIDGDHLVGCEVALAVAEGLLDLAAEGHEAAVAFLSEHTLYVVPRVNPDAAERFFIETRTGRKRNLRPDDRDRDGAIDEDPPNDLNGDGLITMMRVYDPEKADLMPDPGEPRLDVEPDRDKGERAVYTLYVEGIDDDNDGEYDEDDVGGVDLNMNYMHGYREHADGAGPYPVSEPESLALLKFVLAHQNIAVVLTYGRHDNLSKPPDGK